MFSADATIHKSLVTTIPRRRPRNSSEDSVATKGDPKRRKRSLLTNDTFEPLANGLSANNTIAPSNGKVIGGLQHGKIRSSRERSSEPMALALRNKTRKSSARDRRLPTRSGEVVLTKNDSYTVVHEPEIPSHLREVLQSESWRASFASHLRHAVAFTHTHAIVWRYTSSQPTAEQFYIHLPFQPPALPRQALAVGVLVWDSAAAQTGLLAVSPFGNFVYWDNINNAANSDSLRQKSQGHHDTISGMLSGETIVKVVEAEADGFLLALSTGRVVHLSVKDPQGRFVTSIHYMQASSLIAGGMFGSLRNVFSSATWRREVAILKAGPARSKSQRSCIVATSKGSFQVWDIVRHASQSMSYEINGEDTILQSVNAMHEARPFTSDDLTLLDFHICPEQSGGGDRKVKYRLMAILAFKTYEVPENASSVSQASYFLIELVLREDAVDVQVIHPITCYREVFSTDETQRPQLLVSANISMAFLVFPRDIVLISTSHGGGTPSSQLQSEAHALPEAFQDVIQLKRLSDVSVVGCTLNPPEHDQSECSASMLIHGYGMIRVSISARGPAGAPSIAPVTAKAKFEQAIFYGNPSSNLLDLSFPRDRGFSDDEVQKAALKIDDAILRSSSSYLPGIAVSQEQQLKLRAEALTDLIRVINVSGFQLSVAARWHLLQHGEKMAAACAVWQLFNENHRNTYPENLQLLPEMLDMMTEDLKNENQPDRGETDITRHYFIHDVWRIEWLIHWAEQSIEGLHGEGVRDAAKQVSLTIQANEIVLWATEAAFEFRVEKAAQYGFKDDLFENSILTTGWEDIGHSWTCQRFNVQRIEKLMTLTFDVVNGQAEAENPEVATPDLITLAQHFPKLVYLWCQVHEERIRLLKARPKEKDREQGYILEQHYLSQRPKVITDTVSIELPHEGIRLAEKYKDMEALVDVLFQDKAICIDRLDGASPSDSEKEELQEKVSLHGRLQRDYFTKYGSSFYDKFFKKEIENGNSIQLSRTKPEFQAATTDFLRDVRGCEKICWMNDVLGEDDYCQAAHALHRAYHSEKGLWSQNVQLSLSKLALLAAEEKEQVPVSDRERGASQIVGQMDAIVIQERLYEYVLPAVRDAVDQQAKIDLAKDTFCKRYLQNKPYFRKSSERSLATLLNGNALSVEDLIDLVTTIDTNVQSYNDESFAEDRWYLALRLCHRRLSIHGDKALFKFYREVIWRRCMIQDDWNALNRTENKSDMNVARDIEATSVFNAMRLGFKEEDPGSNDTQRQPNGAAVKGMVLDGISSPSLLSPQDIPNPAVIVDLGITRSSLIESGGLRYRHLDEAALDAIVKDFSSESRALKRAIDAGRLELRWNGIVEAAKSYVREEREWKQREFSRRDDAMQEAELGLRGVNGPVGMENGVTEHDHDGDVNMR
ncbi:hypothetical protein MMC25_005384 [Agyrium rufum]|nr:hypothetical protein [Agyrium rufum]